MKALQSAEIPPPIVAFLAAAMMWGIAKVAPAVEIDAGLRFALVALLATIGGIFAFSGSTRSGGEDHNQPDQYRGLRRSSPPAFTAPREIQCISAF